MFSSYRIDPRLDINVVSLSRPRLTRERLYTLTHANRLLQSSHWRPTTRPLVGWLSVVVTRTAWPLCPQMAHWRCGMYRPTGRAVSMRRPSITGSVSDSLLEAVSWFPYSIARLRWYMETRLCTCITWLRYVSGWTDVRLYLSRLKLCTRNRQWENIYCIWYKWI